MIPFEVHITGSDERIMYASKELGVKAIAVELLDRSFNVIKTEYMTSHVIKCECFNEVMEKVIVLKNSLEHDYMVHIVRTKVECPPIKTLFDDSIYIESHFTATDILYPMSRNKTKDYLLATHRIFDTSKYEMFTKFHQGRIVEICLHDEYEDGHSDKYWFCKYGLVDSK